MEKHPYTISQVFSWLEGSIILQNTSLDIQVGALGYDSRIRTIPEKNDLFFALKTDKSDGHHFLSKAFEAGYRHFIVSNESALTDTNFEGANVLLVNDTWNALHEVASRHRKEIGKKTIVVGITGSNGKTTVKTWAAHALPQAYVSPGSWNSKLGVALSIWGMAVLKPAPFALIEAGISKVGEMNALQQMISPQIGVITNLGSAHDAGFRNRKEKLLEKLKLFSQSQKLIYWADDDFVSDNILEALNKGLLPQDIVLISVGTSKSGEYSYEIKELGQDYSFSYKGELLSTFGTQGKDPIKVQNIGLTLSLIHTLGEELDNIEVEAWPSLGLRSQLVKAIGGGVIINDSYSSDMLSLEYALSRLKDISSPDKRGVIITDVPQTGLSTHDHNSQVLKLLEEYEVDKAILIGPMLSAIKPSLGEDAPNGYVSFPNVKEVVFSSPGVVRIKDKDALGKTIDLRGLSLLVKGGRAFKLEKIVAQLEAKVHKTQLHIDLEALSHNYRIYRALVGPKVKMMAVVKAFGYGSGSDEVALRLARLGVDYFAVAYPDEGKALRDAGIKVPIMVINWGVSDLESIQSWNLEPELYDLEGIQTLIDYHRISLSAPINVHLKLDTGMHRLGLLEEEVPRAISLLGESEGIVVASVMSHFASAENPNDDDYTSGQITQFTKLCGLIEIGLGYPFIKHIANSGGIARFPQAHFDMVRLGLGLYGFDPGNTHLQESLEEVSTLYTTINQLKWVKAGSSIGYGTANTVGRDTLVAVIGIGYADGYLRGFGKGNGTVLVRGIEVPTLGNICMDMTMIDVTHVVGVSKDDTVIVFGKGLPIGVLAKRLGTIAHEILTGVSERVKRVYSL